MRKSKRYNGEGRYMTISYNMFESDAFRTLSDKSRSVLLKFLHLFNGSNNGEIHLTPREIRKWYGYGTGTAQKCLVELYEHGFITPLEFGHFTTRTATIWKITFVHNPGELRTDTWKRYDFRLKRVPDIERYCELDRYQKVSGAKTFVCFRSLR